MILVDTPIKPEQSDQADQEYSGPSKSQRKRDSTALQDLGEALAVLPSERLAKIEMPDNLREAIRDVQRITKHEARRRQMQYIGKLMRSTDPLPIQAALDAIAGVSAAENARMHRLERWRMQLLEDEASALAEILAVHPGVDTQQLRQLCRNARKEHEQNKPPRAFREIYRFLKLLEEPHG
ncbi:MAG: ribosome biogenesis factor YjgA [Sterolibacterium sp.]|nr:ribosome biogenesis factor YjgA [Sterolibacterium sp.]